MSRLRHVVYRAALGTLLAAGAAPVAGLSQETAPDGTLADIRQELTVLYVELQRLKRELSTTGAAPSAPGGGDTLARLDAIESEVRRLTDRTELLEFRLDKVVRDGTNRVGDLEFRLCELEPACDIATLGDTPQLGGGTASAAASAPALPVQPDTAELAVGEATDFEAAKAALEKGEPATAAARFDAFLNTYPASPLAAEAQILKGRALEQQGDLSNAARAYLAAFNIAPDAATAPGALLALGLSLDGLGQSAEACTLLGEVSRRFPGGAEAATAMAEATARGCT